MPESPQKEADLARRIRATALARGALATDIATEIHEQCGPLFGTSQVKAQRLALGVALSDVIAQVRALYQLDGRPAPKLGETLLSAYESGYKRPGPEYLHYLCKVYRVDPPALGFQGPCICGGGAMAHQQRPATLSRGQSGPGEGEALVGAVVPPSRADLRPWSQPNDLRGQHRAGDPPANEMGEEDIVLRRTLLQLLAGAGVVSATGPIDGQFLGAVDGLRRKMDDTLVSATVSPMMMDQWEETIYGYGQRYQSTPSLRLLCDVLLDFSEVRRMAGQRQPLELQERLCRVAAHLSGLSGILMIDLGDHRLARSFFRTARTAADETGDRGLRAWVTARESLVPMYYGDPREALHLARKAQDLAGRSPCPAGAMAPAVEARALAMLAARGRGDAGPSARRALGRGRSVWDQLRTEQTSETVFGFTDRQLSFYEGDSYTNLGDHAHGEETLSYALTILPGTDMIDRTLVRLDRAHCKLLSGHPDAAATAGTEALNTLPLEHRSNLLMHRARQLGAAIQAQHGQIAEMAEFRELLAGPQVQSPTVDTPAPPETA